MTDAEVKIRNVIAGAYAAALVASHTNAAVSIEVNRSVWDHLRSLAVKPEETPLSPAKTLWGYPIHLQAQWDETMDRCDVVTRKVIV